MLQGANMGGGSIAFLPDGAMLITERIGRLRLLRHGTLSPRPVGDCRPSRRAVHAVFRD